MIPRACPMLQKFRDDETKKDYFQQYDKANADLFQFLMKNGGFAIMNTRYIDQAYDPLTCDVTH